MLSIVSMRNNLFKSEVEVHFAYIWPFKREIEVNFLRVRRVPSSSRQLRIL